MPQLMFNYNEANYIYEEIGSYYFLTMHALQILFQKQFWKQPMNLWERIP